MTDAFEKAFGDYLEERAYDEAEEALFSMLRAAFAAGWKAAGGEDVSLSNVVQLVRKENHVTLQKIE